MSESAAAPAVRFLCAVEDACAEHRIPCRGGHAIIDSHRRRLWNANQIRIENPEPLDPAEVTCAADQHLAAERFRLITLLAGELVADLAGPLADCGYRSADRSLMVLGTLPPPRSDIGVVAVPAVELLLDRLTTLGEDPDHDPAVGRELIERDAIAATFATQRCYAAIDRSGIVARCQVFSLSGVAQIENVYTHVAHRGRGYAQAVVAAAARSARDAGAGYVFVNANAEGRHRDFYEKLGFVEVARLHRFVRSLD
ncbi:MAG TPA: GNAT family N-acetyltransferase [Solirubrobacteraceae bacterium]|nr:GNAT family N-acetyltransferase [Solirubrobacteraceae bacterium]